MLINGREKVASEKLKNPKAFIHYSQTIDNVYESLEDYNPRKKRRVLIVFDDMIADMESKKKLVVIVTNCFSSLTLTFKKKLYSLLQWKPFKNDEKCFSFYFQSSFRSPDTYGFVMTFWSCMKNGLVRKIGLNSKFMALQPG